MAPCAPGNRYLVAARTLWLGDLARVAAHEFDPMGYNVPTKALPYAALWAASYVDPTLANILPNIGAKALTDVERDYQISTRKCARHLGLGFTPIERTVVDACYSVVGHGLVPAAPAFVPQRCPVGERVSTPFGVGTVVAYRPPPPVTAWDGPGGGARRAAASRDDEYDASGGGGGGGGGGNSGAGGASYSGDGVGMGTGVWEVELDWVLAGGKNARLFIASAAQIVPTAEQADDAFAGLGGGGGADGGGGGGADKGEDEEDDEDDEEEEEEEEDERLQRVRFEVFDARWREEGMLEAGFVLFLIRVRRGSHEWQVEKRYSEIAALHERLLALFPGCVLPRLPPTRLFGNSSASLMNERRSAFEL